MSATRLCGQSLQLLWRLKRFQNNAVSVNGFTTKFVWTDWADSCQKNAVTKISELGGRSLR